MATIPTISIPCVLSGLFTSSSCSGVIAMKKHRAPAANAYLWYNVLPFHSYRFRKLNVVNTNAIAISIRIGGSLTISGPALKSKKKARVIMNPIKANLEGFHGSKLPFLPVTWGIFQAKRKRAPTNTTDEMYCGIGGRYIVRKTFPNTIVTRSKTASTCKFFIV